MALSKKWYQWQVRKHKELYYVPLVLYIDQSSSDCLTGRHEGLEDPASEIMLLDQDILEASNTQHAMYMPFDVIIRDKFYACDYITHDFDEYGQRWTIGLSDRHHGLQNGGDEAHWTYKAT